MTLSKLKEQFAQRGRLQVVDRVPSGSPVDLVLRPAGALSHIRTIDATLALCRRHMTMLKAKRAIEAVVERGSVVVHVPMVECVAALAADLRKNGITVTTLASEPVDVRALREQLGLSQEQFALQFNLDLATVQNWEQGRNIPDRASANYLRVIARQPDEAAAAQEREIA